MSKLNIVVRLQHWMDSVPGQTFLNYAYSWGAAIVILGALFKLTHIPGGNIMLFVGMGTEAIVFFLAAFDRPFDKNEINKELANDFETDEEIQRAEGWITTPSQPTTTPTPALAVAQPLTSQPTPSAPSHPPLQGEAQQLASIIRLANDELLHRAQAVLSPEMEAATQDYIQKLKTLNDTLTKVDQQSARLTQDSQEMENLNRTLIGINKVYELHFASISRQVNTIEDINTQTQQLATKIEEVNAIYTRMMQTLSLMGNNKQ